MTAAVYDAIMTYEDQFVSCRWDTFGLQITIMADDKESVRDVTALARSAGCKVRKTVIGKGEPESEVHLWIR